MNPYHHAIDTKRIALNDNGLLAWVRHNEKAIMDALKCADRIDQLREAGNQTFAMNDLPFLPATAYSPTLDFDAGGKG